MASEAENDGTRTRWNCTCDCGKSVVVATQQLRSGKTVSCKCFHREVVSAMFRKESPGYAAAHHRVWGLRGHAKTHSCVDCGSRAHHWSYDGLDPDELIGDVGGQFLAYSLKPDHYAPRCRSCHAVYDHSTARPRDKSGRFASMQEEAS